jgi:hypothetical protein
MLLLADDTDESGWDSRLDDFKARALQERCGICCVVACVNCSDKDCEDRLPVAIDADSVDSDELEAASDIFDNLDKPW